MATADDLALLEAAAAYDPEAAILLRRYRTAEAVTRLMEMLQAVMEERVHPISLPAIADGFRAVADQLDPPEVRH